MALRMKEVIGMVLRKRLRKLVEAEEILILPGAYDALSAKLVQAAGFQAVYLTGYGQSASKLGEPDVGLMCMSEMAERTRDIAMAVDIPVACDADTGFGNPVNVIRTVREYERAGAAAIQLEDQTMPKKCGHMLGRQVVPAEEMAEKIRAAAAARGDPDFLIIARTDARTEHGIDEAIRRGRLYEEAGADIIFIESLETVDEMKRVNREIRKPTIANMVEGGRTPFLPAWELQEIGYSAVIFPITRLYAAAKAVYDVLADLRENGTSAGSSDRMLCFREFNELIGLPAVRKIESGDLSAVRRDLL